MDFYKHVSRNWWNDGEVKKINMVWEVPVQKSFQLVKHAENPAERRAYEDCSFRKGASLKKALPLTLSIVLLLIRRPDAVLHAQFFAEDATVFYSQAYHEGGFKALLVPHNGYFCLVQRLVAALSLFFPLQYAPLFSNVVALLVKVLPVALILSDRFEIKNAKAKVKYVLVLLYILIPCGAELHANITNAQ